MEKAIHYALDALFLFMLVVGGLLFGLGFFFEVPTEVKETTEKVDYLVLGGYYTFFFYAIHRARNKIKYLKKHWILALLLLAPFFPVARLIKFVQAEEAIFLGLDGLWHVLSELEML